MEIKENEIWGTLTSNALSKKFCILGLVLAIIFSIFIFAGCVVVVLWQTGVIKADGFGDLMDNNKFGFILFFAMLFSFILPVYVLVLYQQRKLHEQIKACLRDPRLCRRRALVTVLSEWYSLVEPRKKVQVSFEIKNGNDKEKIVKVSGRPGKSDGLLNIPNYLIGKDIEILYSPEYDYVLFLK